MKSFNTESESLSWNEKNLFHGTLPKRIVITMVNSRAYKVTYELNPFDFVHKNLKYCNLSVDGKRIPQKHLVSDFTDHSTLRNYLLVARICRKGFQ